MKCMKGKRIKKSTPAAILKLLSPFVNTSTDAYTASIRLLGCFRLL